MIYDQFEKFYIGKLFIFVIKSNGFQFCSYDLNDYFD